MNSSWEETDFNHETTYLTETKQSSFWEKSRLEMKSSHTHVKHPYA